MNVNEYGEPGSTFIQWKGTVACIGIFCHCGEDLHYDGEDAHAYHCPFCNRRYALGTEVTVTEITATDPRYKYAVDLSDPDE